MKIKIMRTLFLLCMTTLVLAACSSSGSNTNQDYKDVNVELLTEGSQVKVGENTLIQVQVTGLKNMDDTNLQFEIREKDSTDLPDSIDEVKSMGVGKYSANYTFKKAAKYDVYIHLYNDNVHMTKKKLLEVTG